jgi:hypothetical protein
MTTEFLMELFYKEIAQRAGYNYFEEVEITFSQFFG